MGLCDSDAIPANEGPNECDGVKATVFCGGPPQLRLH